MESTVRVIKANPFLNARGEDINYTRVAAYARVSTGFEEQEDSFDRQVDYYTRFIQANPNWKFVKIYSDPGISGTRAEKRPGFQEMIEDCKKGLIDRILVKSIARFARNTVDALKYIRELKELGVSIYFEAQKIDTMTPGGDILLTILAATAEEESRTISKNVKWSMTKKFEKGDFMLNYTCFLGYTKDKDGTWKIVEKEAEVVRRIYREFLYGYTIFKIVQELNEDKIPSPSGKIGSWQYTVVKSILTNEKYYGMVIMQKTYKPDVLSKKRLKNEGQVDSFYAKDKLPPIIDKATFDMVQYELKHRDEIKGCGNKSYGKFASKYPFSKMIRCGCCGAFYVRNQNMRLNGKHIPSWWCSEHWHDESKCSQKGISEESLKKAFVEALNSLVTDVDDIKNTIKSTITSLLTNKPTNELDAIDQKISDLQEEMMNLHKNKTSGKINQTEYGRNGDKISRKIEELKEQKEELLNSYASNELTIKRVEEINKALDTIQINDEFNEDLFRRLVESVTINDRCKITFKFKVGIEKTIIANIK